MILASESPAKLLHNDQLDQTKALYSEIIGALNSHSTLMSRCLNGDLASIVKSNKKLTKTIEHVERRNLTLETKLEKLKRFEKLIKNCQRLQCKECHKLYTPLLFVSHVTMCQKPKRHTILVPPR